MYIPKPFRMEEQETLYAFIEQNSFGILISAPSSSASPSALQASHLPFLLQPEKHCLTSHLARGNDQWRELEGQEVLVIFQGPHHYISPSWYGTNAAVPTWNYTAVHVYGRVELLDDRAMFPMLQELVNTYEEPSSVYRLDESNEELVTGLLQGIVGFNIRISRIEGQWKLSQNHSRDRQERVIQGLRGAQNEQAASLAALMQGNLK
ncbi:FMN-binding negative transcriptional regulator [Paenibacillus sp. F411]|uniref:Transcriptional regulator, putative n=1 Tax=Paenibacillus algicola TaxID=2565926 RepID=A0A4P8XKU7_9BACL|nr:MULTISPECIES: FMN-binding negative transcriptional regulator [Paenibacillus]MBO2942691.1 FMN-binding negative transcriptional regulator [Paenibacillus sp. F411]QCT03367.1 transcriptional regulator, putative [Paenibacillus algicola]